MKVAKYSKPLEHLIIYGLSLTGLNHEIAIDVAFLPMYSPEDVRTSQIDTFLTCMNYSCVYPPEAPGSGRLSDIKEVAGDLFLFRKKNTINDPNLFSMAEFLLFKLL